jgi:hypothetical protein
MRSSLYLYISIQNLAEKTREVEMTQPVVRIFHPYRHMNNTHLFPY